MSRHLYTLVDDGFVTEGLPNANLKLNQYVQEKTQLPLKELNLTRDGNLITVKHKDKTVFTFILEKVVNRHGEVISLDFFVSD